MRETGGMTRPFASFPPVLPIVAATLLALAACGGTGNEAATSDPAAGNAAESLHNRAGELDAAAANQVAAVQSRMAAQTQAVAETGNEALATNMVQDRKTITPVDDERHIGNGG